MKKMNTIKSLLFTLLLLSSSTVFAQVFWTETFSDQATATTNWVYSGTNAGAEKWFWTSDPEAGFQSPNVPAFGAPTASTGYFLFNSDINKNASVHDVRLTGTGTPVNCTGKNDVKLSFYAQYAHATAAAKAQVGVSTDGVTFVYKDLFATLPVDNLFHGVVEVPLPEANNKASIWIQFRWIGAWEYHFKVDDLSLSATPVALPCDQNPNAIICDNLESYTTGPVSPQALWWKPWVGAENNILSALVSTEQASQGTKSMRVAYAVSGADQGSNQLLLLGNKTTGRYELKWKMYIPSGNAGYYNVQNSETPDIQWNLDVYFDSTGIARMIVNPIATNQTPNVTFAFPKDKWFTLTSYFDLDNNLAKLSLDGNIIYGWAYSSNLGGIDFYSANAWDRYYVDELEYISLPVLVFNPDNCASAVDLTQYFGQAPNVPQSTGLYDNTNATASLTDPQITCWIDGGINAIDKLNNTMWYTFNGDGKTYHIETAKCNATNYIGSALPDIQGFNPDGDTQMAIFSGQCGNATLVACNDDQSPEGIPDFRAGLDFPTVPGETYFMMIDGFEYVNNQIATGQYCIEITQLPSIVCAQGQVGDYSLDNDGFVCTGTNLADYITLEDTAFKIPTIGPIYGLCWAITSAPVPAGTWPPSMGTSYISSTGFINAPFAIGLANNVTAISSLYITPVVVSGATEVTPATPLHMENVSVDNPDACFFTGISSVITLFPALNPLSGTATSTPPNNGTANNGTINLTADGGFGQVLGDPAFYNFVWSNGATTEDLSGLTAGTYTVTISDFSNCVDPVQVQVTVIGTAVKDPESVKTLFISPNPTQGKLMLNLELNATAEVRVELINSVGQTLQTIHAGQLNNLNQEIDLHNLANGTYIVRVIMDAETAVRKVILQK